MMTSGSSLRQKRKTTTADIPEGQVTYAGPSDTAHDQGMDLIKVRLFRWENPCENGLR